MNSHNLHRIVGQILNEFHNPPSTSVILDRECGGAQRVALFATRRKSRSTNYCWVDATLVRNREVRAIVEIEQSGLVTPAKVGGKLLPAALSSCLISRTEGPGPIEMARQVTFIQIVNTAWLKPTTRKLLQYENLEADIRGLLPLGSISVYFLLAGTLDSFLAGAHNYASLIAALKGSLHDPC